MTVRENAMTYTEKNLANPKNLMKIKVQTNEISKSATNLEGFGTQTLKSATNLEGFGTRISKSATNLEGFGTRISKSAVNLEGFGTRISKSAMQNEILFNKTLYHFITLPLYHFTKQVNNQNKYKLYNINLKISSR